MDQDRKVSNDSATGNSGEQVFKIREVVAIFDDVKALEDAIEKLEISGTDRAAISVLASRETVDSKLGSLRREVSETSDADDVAQGVEVNRYEMAEGKAAAISVPAYIGLTAGLIAGFAIGGDIIVATVVGLAGGTVGGGFGAMAARALGKHHAEHLELQLDNGGLLLWVRVADEADEQAKIELLRSAGGTDVHGHLYQRQWGIDEVPLHDAHPDPLLIRE